MILAGRRAAVGLVAVALWTATGLAAHTEPRAIVELFTSQGCSSCPPADELLAELRKDPTLVVVSLPVHYWDYLGWKDTLADPRHTARQISYSRVRGDGGVYTPQVVVNGAVHALGSDRAAIENAVHTAHGRGARLSVKVDVVVVDGKVTVSVGKGEEDFAGEVWLWAVASTIPVAIQRGENKGRTVNYANVVRRWIKLGDWRSGANWTIPVSDVSADAVDQVAVVVQSGSHTAPGTILGAGLAALR